MPAIIAEFGWRGDAEMAASYLSEVYGPEGLEVTVIGSRDRDAARMARGTAGLDLSAVTFLTGMTASPGPQERAGPEQPAGTTLLVARVDQPHMVGLVASLLWRTGAVRVDVTGQV